MRYFLVRKINSFTKTLSLGAKVPNTYGARLYIGPASVLFSLLGFDFGAMWGCFSDVFGLPYRLASLLIDVI